MNIKFNNSTISGREIALIVARVGIASVVTYYSLKWMMKQLDPTSKGKKEAQKKAHQQMKKLGLHVENKLSEHELVIASHLVVPDEITVTWDHIAGLEHVIQELRESVVLPIQHRKLFQNSQLWQSPKGVLLHGPPGCGKTLIAKATAKEAGMRFINLDVAMLTDKWYGESQKLASAVFTLAAKLEPCIIFIDEIESFLRSRNQQDHEATAMMKTQFMMNWDGLSTDGGATVIVMGATNRPQDLDKAILRRMPAQFHIGLPNKKQRENILSLILRNEQLNDDINVVKLAESTQGFSGSDLRELCRNATVSRAREYMRENFSSNDRSGTLPNSSSSSGHQDLTRPPPIGQKDLEKAFSKMRQSKASMGTILKVDNQPTLD